MRRRSLTQFRYLSRRDRLSATKGPGPATAACLLTALLNLSAAAHAAQAQEKFTLESASYADLRQLVTQPGSGSKVDVPAQLDFPADGKGKYPAVVIVHTLGGYQESNEGWYAAEFRKAGFA